MLLVSESYASILRTYRGHCVFCSWHQNSLVLFGTEFGLIMYVRWLNVEASNVTKMASIAIDVCILMMLAELRGLVGDVSEMGFYARDGQQAHFCSGEWKRQARGDRALDRTCIDAINAHLDNIINVWERQICREGETAR